MARTLEEAERQIALLVEENRRLAGELEALQTSGPALEKVTREAIAARRAAEDSSASLKTQVETAQKQVTELRQANSTLTATVTRLNSQVQKAPLNPLTVEEASQMFERVVSPFRNSRTLEVRAVSLNLKLATGKLGDQTVLMVPDPVTANPALLHEVRLDLISRPAEVSTPVKPIGPVRPIEPIVPILRAPKKAAAKKAAMKAKPK